MDIKAEQSAGSQKEIATRSFLHPTRTSKMHLSVSSLYFLSCLIFGASAKAFTNSTPLSTCHKLSSALSDDVFLPDTDTYNASITSYPFVQLRLHPTCVLRPKSANDVATTVKILRENSHTKFAVRGGGHNANTGFANIHNGVTIDMRSMNSVGVYGDVVRVGAGAIWQDVYDAIEPLNLTVLGGRIGVVGVAGFTTGGRSYIYFRPIHTIEFHTS
jgi:hypothetical protein